LPSPHVAQIKLGGCESLSLCEQVDEAERKLRTVLLRNGLQPKEGFLLARYNEPFVLPAVRRNEVLIDLHDMQLSEIVSKIQAR
jgi:hypothetical protein